MRKSVFGTGKRSVVKGRYPGAQRKDPRSREGVLTAKKGSQDQGKSCRIKEGFQQ